MARLSVCLCWNNVSKSQADEDCTGEDKAVLVACVLSNSLIVENLFTNGC